MNSQTILMSQTLQRCRCLDLGFTVAVVEALAFGGQDMFDGHLRQTDCLALLKVSGSGLLFSTASCLCCSRGLSIGVGAQLWGHRRHTALTALQGVLGFLLFSRHKPEMSLGLGVFAFLPTQARNVLGSWGFCFSPDTSQR